MAQITLDELISIIETRPQEDSLDVSGNELPLDFLEIILGYKEISKLNLSSCSIDGSYMDLFEENKTITHLDLSNNKIEDRDFDYDKTSITHLNLANTGKSKGFRDLLTSKNLISLDISGNTIRYSGGVFSTALSSNLNKLKIEFSSNENKLYNATFPNLETIEIKDGRLDSGQLRLFKQKSPNLKHIKLINNDIVWAAVNELCTFERALNLEICNSTLSYKDYLKMLNNKDISCKGSGNTYISNLGRCRNCNNYTYNLDKQHQDSLEVIEDILAIRPINAKKTQSSITEVLYNAKDLEDKEEGNKGLYQFVFTTIISSKDICKQELLKGINLKEFKKDLLQGFGAKNSRKKAVSNLLAQNALENDNEYFDNFLQTIKDPYVMLESFVGLSQAEQIALQKSLQPHLQDQPKTKAYIAKIIRLNNQDKPKDYVEFDHKEFKQQILSMSKEDLTNKDLMPKYHEYIDNQGLVALFEDLKYEQQIVILRLFPEEFVNAKDGASKEIHQIIKTTHEKEKQAKETQNLMQTLASVEGAER